MAIGLTITVEGLSQLNKKLDAIKTYVNTSIVPFKQASAVVVASVLKNFAVGGRPSWEPLSPLTLYIRANRVSRKNKNAMPLVDTGRLRNSIVPQYDTDDTVGYFGAKTNVEYAGKMQFGGVSEASEIMIGKKPSRATPTSPFGKTKKFRRGMTMVTSYIMHVKSGHRIPPRPFMLVQKSDYPILQAIFKDWLKEAHNV